MIIHAIDTETTGLTDSDEVIELAIVEWNDGARRVLFEERFSPVGLVDVGAARVNGYSPETWGTHPRFNYRTAERVAEILSGVKFWLGSNPSFDQGKLKEMFRRTRTPWPSNRMMLRDTASLGLGLQVLGVVNSTSLGALLEFSGLETQKHNALSDCQQALDVFERLLEVQMTGYAKL